MCNAKSKTILYVGPIGKNWIDDCIPHEARVEFLESTNILRHISSIRFLFFFCFNFFRDFSYVVRYPRSLAQLSALDAQKKDLILSCSDNWPWLQYYSSRRSSPTFLVQNATRKCSERRKKFSPILSTYVAWGEIENVIFRTCSISVKNFYPVGSLKLGVAFEKYRDSVSHAKKDIVFISQFRPTKGFMEPSSFDPKEIDSVINKYQQISFQLVHDFARKNNREVTVISKTRGPVHYQLEKDYFANLACEYDFEFIAGDKEKREFDTYFSCFSANVIVSLSSSLAFEMLAAGKKVLFTGSGLDNFPAQFDVEAYFDALPREVKLEEQSLDHFNRKLLELESLSELDFQALVLGPARSIVNFYTEELPQHRIKSILHQKLQITS